MLSTPTPGDWILISIFYGKSQLKELIAQALSPMLTENLKNGSIRSIYSALSSYQGDNLRIAFECTTGNNVNLIEDIHNQLQTYLSENPSILSKIDYFGKSFFMDFPNNSIQYNLYQLITINPYINTLRSTVSERILAFLAEDENDEASFLTFALSNMMIFCQVAENVYDHSINTRILEFLYEGDHNADLKKMFKLYDQLFEGNKEMIVALYNEVITPDFEDPDGLCISDLKKQYHDLLSNNNPIDLMDEQSVLIPLDRFVIEQLNMHESMLKPLYYMIHLCFKSLHEPNPEI